MTIEQIELRKILTQMLADNGINRETVVGFVKEIVDERVDKAIDKMIHEKDMDSLVYSCVKNSITREVKDEIADKVRRTLGNVSISIECHEKMN